MPEAGRRKRTEGTWKRPLRKHWDAMTEKEREDCVGALLATRQELWKAFLPHERVGLAKKIADVSYGSLDERIQAALASLSTREGIEPPYREYVRGETEGWLSDKGYPPAKPARRK